MTRPYYPVHITLRTRIEGAHLVMRVFAGPAPGSLALLGELRFAPQDWHAWRGLFSAVAVAGERTGLAGVTLDHDDVIESGWPETSHG